MRIRAAVLTTAAVLLLSLSGCFSPAQDNYLVEVTGEIERTMEGGELFLESIPGGKQIYIQKAGSGENMQVLQVLLPESIQEGEYQIYPNTTVTASYWDRNAEGSWIFSEDPRGRVLIERDGTSLRGTIDFSAEEYLGDGLVHVHAEIWDVPFPESGPGVQQGDFPSEPPEGAGSSGGSAGTFVTCGLIGFLIVNFGIQFYVGRRVYPASRAFWLRSLNGTRTFIRGWKDPDLRSLMVVWSVLLGLFGVVLCLVIALTQM